MNVGSTLSSKRGSLSAGNNSILQCHSSDLETNLLSKIASINQEKEKETGSYEAGGT